MSAVQADQKKVLSEAPEPSAIAVAADEEEAVAEFDTDVVYDDLNFTKHGVKEQTWCGMPSFSCRFFRQSYHLIRMATSMEKRQVVIFDARKRNLDYEKCGFTLRPLKSQVTDWQQVGITGSEQQNLFQAELEKVIRDLHPDVKKIEFSSNLLRGGSGANPPATNGLHLDVYPDMKRVKAVQNEGAKETEDGDSDGLEMKIMLGLWMPREMANPVYDYPFFFGDASTFAPEDVVPQMQDFYHIAEGQRQRLLNLAAGAPIFSPRQRWYYYSQQTCEEVVVFRHLTEPAGGKACFHAAFQQPLPEGMETRKSIETRALLFFPKSSESQA